MMNRIRSTQSLFVKKEQDNAVDATDFSSFHKTSNVEEWNKARELFIHNHKGGLMNLLMLLGYIDGILHSQLFGRKEVA